MEARDENGLRRFLGPMQLTALGMGALSCLLLMFSLPAANWWRLVAWLALGFIIYFLYGKKHSVMRQQRA